MVQLKTASVLLGCGLLSTAANAFAPTPTANNVHLGSRVPVAVSKPSSSSSSSALTAIPEMNDMIQSSSNMLLSAVDGDAFRELAKSAVIVLLFGGGLIPAAIAANKAMVGTLQGKRRGGDAGNDYVADSGASGPPLPGQALLFASETVPLVDIIAIMGRIQSAEKLCDWRNLPSTEQSPNVMWLPRDMYKANIRKAKFTGWPVDPATGEPVGGKELEKAEKGRISKNNAVIGDAALDAVFDSWAWGASVGTQDKVEATLAQYKNGNTLDLNEFTAAAARGRAVTGVGALSFIVIQVTAYGSLFIAPFLRVFFDLDIGFGQLGGCDGTCNSLF